MRGPVEEYLQEIVDGLEDAGFFEQSIVTKNTLLKHFLNAISLACEWQALCADAGSVARPARHAAG